MATTTYTLAECQEHTTEKDCWLIIEGKVYNVTNFLDEHPGGYDIVVAAAGKDATESFEEIGHSNAAKQMLADYLIGDLAGADASAAKSAVQPKAGGPATPGSSSFGTLIKALLPLIIILAAIYYQAYLKPKTA
ncbi:hypothetical protein N2152v2_006570 [Parachlorella kessleri]